LPMRRSLPVFPHEQTSAASVGMSQKCQKPTSSGVALWVRLTLAIRPRAA
jgi:hypothetical protein